MPNVSAQIDLEIDTLLENESKNSGMSKSALIRQYIRNGVVSGKRTEPQTPVTAIQPQPQIEVSEPVKESEEPKEKEPIKTKEELDAEKEEKEREEYRETERLIEDLINRGFRLTCDSL